MKWRHSRKGIIEGELVADNPRSEFVRINLTNTVHGRGESWYPGETISVKRSLLHRIDPGPPVEILEEGKGDEGDPGAGR